MCDGWTTRDLAAHLFVRERRPLAAPAIVLPKLAGLAEQSMSAVQERHDYSEQVKILRGGAPLWSPFRLLDAQLNLLEYFVHHEDVRRAQPDWQPRELEPAEQDVIWERLKSFVRSRPNKPRGGRVLQRSDTGAVLRLSAGSPTVTLVGPVSELTLYAFGRRAVARVERHSDPDDARADDAAMDG